MHKPLRQHFRTRLASVRPLIPAVLLACGLATAGAQSQDDSKPYTLFLGANIFVGQGGDVHPVRDVNGSSWVVGVNGQEVVVSAAGGPISMKIVPVQKLTETSASISDLKAERAYTFANDPSVKLTRGMSQSATVDASQHSAVNQATALSNSAISTGQTSNSVATSSQGRPVAGVDATQQALNAAQANLSATSNDADIFLRDANSESGDFDALDASFEISSQRRLGEPYIVVITRFHERGAAEGAVRDLVYAKALEAIDAKPAKVKFEQAGFPLGYELRGFEIHLYDRGVEIATNVAAKREVLSCDQAFDFVKAAYLGAHKSDTLGAVPAIVGKMPADLQEKLAAGMYGATIYVRVSKEGAAGSAFADAACSKAITDPYLDTVLRSIYFKPALAQGKPVEGVSSLNLSRLKI
jgi:antitoxin (DNA-binding transcriptional repressor) of toxin-antitoxin stability system